jgi:hypothetical protein
VSGARCSGKSLVQKLGIRLGDKVVFVGAPAGYRKILGPLPDGVRIVDSESHDLDFVHVFIRNRRALQEQLMGLRNRIKPSGMIWVSWPNQAAGVATNLTETNVRKIAIEAGLVDVKVAAIDETKSGLKLVIRVKDRRSSDGFLESGLRHASTAGSHPRTRTRSQMD